MTWRRARSIDLPAIKRLSDRIHTTLPEDIEVFAERARLYPDGFLVCEIGDRLAGYAVTHPWMRDSVPSLNALLGAIPADADTYYFHDVALDGSARGQDLGSQAIALLKQQARLAGFRTINLVAVNDSEGFWRRHGFKAKDADGVAQKLASYGAEARYMECADV